MIGLSRLKNEGIGVLKDGSSSFLRTRRCGLRMLCDTLHGDPPHCTE